MSIHPGLLAEVSKLLYQLGSTVRILTEELPGPAGSLPDREPLPAARALQRKEKGVAARFILCDLRNDHVGAVHLDRVTDTKLERIKDVG